MPPAWIANVICIFELLLTNRRLVRIVKIIVATARLFFATLHSLYISRKWEPLPVWNESKDMQGMVINMEEAKQF